MRHSDPPKHHKRRGSISYWFSVQVGSTGALLGFTVLVTILAACGLSGLVP